MIELTRTSVMNMENALRGARNPLNSWARSDSAYDENGNYRLGENDLGLAKRLCRAGSDHRKFLRQILVSVDIAAPLYWWKEFDTYKVGTVANSTSTMHKIHSQSFAAEQFSCDRMSPETRAVLGWADSTSGNTASPFCGNQGQAVLERYDSAAAFQLQSAADLHHELRKSVEYVPGEEKSQAGGMACFLRLDRLPALCSGSDYL